MPIPPLPAAGALLAAAPLAQAAVSGVSAKFAELLAAAASPAAGHGEASPSGLGTEGLTGGLPATPAPNAAKLKTETAGLLRQFHDLLTSLLRERDIDAGAGFRLESDADGAVRVAGHHAESFRIEELFAVHPELRQLFDNIVARAELLRTIEQPAGARVDSTPFGVVMDGERAAVD
jgi:hypothetical protein